MNKASKSRQRGLTLVESLVSLGVCVTALGSAVPSLDHLRARQHLVGATAQLQTELAYRAAWPWRATRLCTWDSSRQARRPATSSTPASLATALASRARQSANRGPRRCAPSNMTALPPSPCGPTQDPLASRRTTAPSPQRRRWQPPTAAARSCAWSSTSWVACAAARHRLACRNTLAAELPREHGST